MAEHCTLFCPKVAYPQVSHYLEHNAQGEVSRVGESDSWETLVVHGATSILTLTALKYEKGGDRFSHLILSTHNFFRNLPFPGPNQQRILEALLDCQWIIGVVAEESFEAEDNEALVFAIAELLDAMIFDGNGMLDKAGNLILDAQGNSDIFP